LLFGIAKLHIVNGGPGCNLLLLLDACAGISNAPKGVKEGFTVYYIKFGAHRTGIKPA
jgi:hypothetical protein